MNDPLALFLAWYREAAELPQPDAMVLATATTEGCPSVRTVLYRPADDGGIRFFTSYESRKGRELAENPRAAVLFHWQPLGRQVRAEGVLHRTSADESDAYFASRPRMSQLAACVSPQSAEIQDLAALEREAARLDAIYADRPVPRPPFWGGFRLEPERWEFWTSRKHRLHERVEFTLEGERFVRRLLGP